MSVRMNALRERIVTATSVVSQRFARSRPNFYARLETCMSVQTSTTIQINVLPRHGDRNLVVPYTIDYGHYDSAQPILETNLLRDGSVRGRARREIARTRFNPIGSTESKKIKNDKGTFRLSAYARKVENAAQVV